MSDFLVSSQAPYREAHRILSEVIPIFEKGGEHALLADALTIQGIVWARLRAFDSSLHILRRAIEVAHDSEALSNAGLAALTLIEEHGDTRLSESDLAAIYQRVDEWLKDTQDAEEIARLRACALVVARKLSVSQAKLSGEGFSLPGVVLAYERRFIEEALELEHGVLTRAAKRLGISRQQLAYLLDTRHRNLRHKRKPAGRS